MFQSSIDIVVSVVQRKFALIYLDKVLIFSETLCQRIEQIRTVPSLLREGGPSFMLSKRAFPANKTN